MKKKILVRRVPCTIAEFKKVQKTAAEALRLASKHDPDLEERIVILERQMKRLGAPQYRRVK
jgi:hypothetical protein